MTTQRGSTYISVYLASLQHASLAGLTGEVDGITLDGTLRIANFRHNFTSRGDVFAPGFFRVKPPKLGGRRGQLTLAIDNVDQRLTKTVRALTGRATLTLERVYAHAPDTVRQTWAGIELEVFNTSSPEVTGTFGPPHTEGPFMGIVINPVDYPGAFV